MPTRLSESDTNIRTRLPASVYDLAMRLGVKAQDDYASVTLTQRGRMKRTLDGDSWLPFTASQTIATRSCEFDWRARMSVLGLISARDALAHSVGCLDVNAFGFIPIVRTKHTAALVRGELMRYLAEIAWAPHAILFNLSLRWRHHDTNTLSVTAGSDDRESTVMLTLDTDGRIANAFAADRPRAATPPIMPTPWSGRFTDYRLQGTVWIPFGGEVGWIIDGKGIVYFQCAIKQWGDVVGPAR